MPFMSVVRYLGRTDNIGTSNKKSDLAQDVVRVTAAGLNHLGRVILIASDGL